MNMRNSQKAPHGGSYGRNWTFEGQSAAKSFLGSSKRYSLIKNQSFQCRFFWKNTIFWPKIYVWITGKKGKRAFVLPISCGRELDLWMFSFFYPWIRNVLTFFWINKHRLACVTYGKSMVTFGVFCCGTVPPLQLWIVLMIGISLATIQFGSAATALIVFR